ncbi:MAG TPA: SDR family oxidoreductase [Bacteroidales bacterium]|nr:SDR family oxidoreductase [Bacteroidales bacterium]HRZ77290.1 SDR family oxidoreductase [Bacteroidales bacterium]
MNVIVTGASRGIGYEVVRCFARVRENNILAISRNKQALNALKKECRDSHCPGKVYILPYDLGRPDMDKGLMPLIQAYFGQVDILINNAGALVNKPFLELSGEDFETLFRVNVFSAFRLSQFVVPIMGKGGHILNISSMGGFQGSVKFSGLSLYSASKGALAILTEAMAAELAPLGISVNCLALGSVQTEMLAEAFPGYEAPVDAPAMARFVCNFAENGQRYMNGKILPVALSTP